MGKKSGSEIRIRDEQHGLYFRELRNNLLVKILKFLDANPGSGMERIRIRDEKNSDPGWKKFGSATLSAWIHMDFSLRIWKRFDIKSFSAYLFFEREACLGPIFALDVKIIEFPEVANKHLLPVVLVIELQQVHNAGHLVVPALLLSDAPVHQENTF
jgi:hypothetical protein